MNLRLVLNQRRIRGRRLIVEAPDPIVAYEVTHYMSLTQQPIATVLSGELHVAQAEAYKLMGGGITSKDWNFRPIRKSDLEKLRTNVG